jgi:hypothetical protein
MSAIRPTREYFCPVRWFAIHSSRFLVALRRAHVNVFYIIGWPAMMGKAARLPLSIMMQEHDDAHSAAAG